MSYAPVGEVSECDFVLLRRLNGGVAVLFSIVSALLLAAAAVDTKGTAPVKTAWWYRTKDADGVIAYVQRVGDVDSHVHLFYLSFLFTALAAVDHALVCTVLHTAYKSQVRAGRNAFRWAEYFFSASIMNVMIALLSGVLDVCLLLAVGLLTATCMVFGWVGEVIPGGSDRTAVFWLGCVPYLGAWAIIASAFFVNITAAGVIIPSFVYAIMVVLFVLESAFGFNQLRATTYLRREIAFILLSPTAKLLLAGITWGGIHAL